jgi:hypothetical protein
MTRRIPLGLMAVILCCASSLAQAAAEPVKWYSGINCDRKELLQSYPLPPGLSSDVVVRDLLQRPLLRSDTQFESACAAFGKQWKVQKQPTFLVFLETKVHHKLQAGERYNGFTIPPSGSADEKAHQLRIGMYQSDAAGKYRLVARTPEPVDFEESEEVKTLDFAPYKLTPTEYAFGVRLYQNFMYAGGGGGNINLNVYRVQGNEIRLILNTLISSSAFTRAEDRGDDVPAEISVLPTHTDGVFDWKKRKGKRWAVFVWNGEAYDVRGKDPVEDVN